MQVQILIEVYSLFPVDSVILQSETYNKTSKIKDDMPIKINNN